MAYIALPSAPSAANLEAGAHELAGLDTRRDTVSPSPA